MANPVELEFDGVRASAANPLPVTGGGSSTSPSQVQIRDENLDLVEWAGASPAYPGVAAITWRSAAASLGLDTTAGAASITLVAAAGASVRSYLTYFSIEWEALTAATEWHIRDGAAGTILWGGKTPAAIAGRDKNPSGMVLFSTANTLLEFRTVTATTAGRIWFNAGGWQGA